MVTMVMGYIPVVSFDLRYQSGICISYILLLHESKALPRMSVNNKDILQLLCYFTKDIKIFKDVLIVLIKHPAPYYAISWLL